LRDIDIKKLTEQLDAAQEILDQIRVTSGCQVSAPQRSKPSSRVESAVETARRAYDERKARAKFVGNEDMFGEPAWDILLDLFIRQANEERVTVKIASLSADMTPTTTMRWLYVLELNQLIQSHVDPADPNRHQIHLTPAGYEGMLRYLESIAK
jgi:hypothetical protein